MTWWAERFKGPQRVGCLLIFIFLLLTLVHSSSPRQKSENDLVFEEDHETSRNLIITGKSSSPHKRGKTNSSDKVIDKNKRFKWEPNDDTGDGVGRLSQPSHRRPSSSSKIPKELSVGLASPYRLTNEGRKRATRVSETDDEDLINSGDELGSGERPATEYNPSVGGTGGGERPGPGRGDESTSFEKRYYRVTLTIGKSWSPSLETRSSSAFAVYQHELEREIRQVMSLEAEHIQIVNFQNINDPAFVRCVFDLGVVGTPTEQVEEEFLTYLDVGSIGQLRIRRDGFSVRDIGAPPESCPDDFLECKNGNCVPIAARCNSVQDCGPTDNTDELGCISVTLPTTTSAPVKLTTTTRPSIEVAKKVDQDTVANGADSGNEGQLPTSKMSERCLPSDQIDCSPIGSVGDCDVDLTLCNSAECIQRSMMCKCKYRKSCVSWKCLLNLKKHHLV